MPRRHSSDTTVIEAIPGTIRWPKDRAEVIEMIAKEWNTDVFGAIDLILDDWARMVAGCGSLIVASSYKDTDDARRIRGEIS